MRITLERLFADPPVTGRPLRGTAWHPTGTHLTYLEPSESDPEVRDLWGFELESGQRHRWIEGARLTPPEEASKPISLDGYQWFPDGTRVLLTSGGSSWVWDTQASDLRRLVGDLDRDVTPRLSPAGNLLAYVRAGNLCVLDLASAEERALTSDGSDTVLNGKLDWVYWEEIGGRGGYASFEWSPDGALLAFLRLDQSGVPTYPLVDAMETHPRLTQQRYPKAGDQNSLPSVHIVDVATGALLASEYLPWEDGYLPPFFAWTADSTALAWSAVSRDQRTLRLSLTTARSGGTRLLLEEADDHWLNHLGPAHFLPDGSFLWRTEAGTRGHLHRYDSSGSRMNAVTQGDWQVERIHGILGEYVYVTGTGTDARERHLYRARVDGGGCQQLTPSGAVHRCDWQPQAGWSLVTHETPTLPAETRLHSPDGLPGTVVWEPDPQWAAYEWGNPEFVDLAAEDGTVLHARLLFPEGFDPNRRYPVVVRVYGGPHAQVVQKGWVGGDPLEALLLQKGFLVWRLDNRGAWGRGHAFETPVDRNLGATELRDQLVGVDYLKSLAYVDAERISISGWSYGGYLTLYAMTHAPEVWRCGIAGAPVTDWKLYDSIYTERYMGTPAENPEGYRKSSVLESAGSLAAPLLLAHGTDDDNVHLQQTLQFIEALSRHRKPYELLLQPRQKHGFTGKEARTYLHERMVEFFRRHNGL